MLMECLFDIFYLQTKPQVHMIGHPITFGINLIVILCLPLIIPAAIISQRQVITTGNYSFIKNANLDKGIDIWDLVDPLKPISCFSVG